MTATAEKLETQEADPTGLSLPIELPPREQALATFTDVAKLKPYLDAIAQRARSLVPDLSTAKGRKAIASNAANVAKSKTALDAVGKELVDEYKEIPKKIDAGRKKARDFLDALKEEVRKPLSDWEAAEESRVAGHKARITDIKALSLDTESMGSAAVRKRLDESDLVDPSTFEEFEGEAAAALVITQKLLREALTKREAFEAEQERLEQQRREQEAERQRLERERIEQQAAEKARRDAEAAAQAEREASQRREVEARLAQERAEREKAEAVDRARLAEQRAQEQAEQAARDAEARIKREAEEAAAREAHQKAQREADKAHRGKVNGEAKAALISLGLSDEQAKAVVIAIIECKVPHVSICY